MAHLIDKDALVAEIDLRINNLESTKKAGLISKRNANERIGILRGIISFINTLEVKEVDFEREMQAFAMINLEPLVISDLNIGISITMSQLYNCAKHFFGLGLKAQKGEKV